MNESASAPERTMALGREKSALPAGAPPGEVWTVLYRHGHREREADSLADAAEAVQADRDLVAWVGMTDPDREQLLEAADRFALPRLAMEDAIVAHQRPKVETYGDVLFVVLRPARYDEDAETVDVGEIHVFGSRDFVITIRHTRQIDFTVIRERLEAEPQMLTHGPLAVLYGVLDQVVDAYAPAVAELQDDIDEVESEVFDGDRDASRRTYRLARQVIRLQRAVDPLAEVLDRLMAPLEHPERFRSHMPRPGQEHRAELRNYLRDVADHVAATREHVDGFRQLLENITEVHSALIGQSQNEAMKKVSSWGGILVVPTLISSVFGMNIAPEPGYHWVFSWPLVLAFMALSSLLLYLLFRRNGWL
ncbi:magnesium and cobalt transport protein CorA [Nocardiopsis ganjiahuensis]|uniref:magnesium and cobalt transport protein CorA n=1 Tax=Nocardiopsis ganjiahuensis TaxID=239984 RepID=UPI00034675E8|nr:magnesium and cobalt transport protein CorA [Nocardiopsis ganjiahuensis]